MVSKETAIDWLESKKELVSIKFNTILRVWELAIMGNKTYYGSTLQETVTTAMQNRHQCLIESVEISPPFQMIVFERDIEEKCKDIWERPEKYHSKYTYTPGTEEIWKEFLKYLWVRFPDGRERRVADIAIKGI